MERAKALRRSQTDGEAKLWSCLRADQLGVKFRRQHRLAGYVLDFVCLERRLVVELDGSQHFEQAAYDEGRTAALEALGFRVLRFRNHHALQQTGDVLNTIVAALNEPQPPHPGPLPRHSRGRGRRAARAPRRAADAGEHQTPSPPTVSRLGETAGVRGQLPHAAGNSGKQESSRHAALHLRARLNALIRGFFAARGVTEVATPILSAAGNTEPNIEGFTTVFSGPVAGGAPERFLRTSAEYPLKRLLAAGFGDCYELGRVFRNGEAGRSHNPEFTLLEWYRVGFDHHRLALETARLVRAALELVQRDAAVATTSYRDWFWNRLQLDPFTAGDDALREPLRDFSIDPEGLRRDDWLDLLVTHRLQPALPEGAITVVYDFPASQCSLARIRTSAPPVAERFELYLGQRELANGYHELNDAAEQRTRFQRENALRTARGQRELPLDENLLAALDALPDCAGVALGVDRLLMGLLGTTDIADVLAFPFAEA